VDILTKSPDTLPSQAAEQISLQRLKTKESELTAKDIMVPIPIIEINSTIQDAAKSMIDNNSGIIAVISNDKLVGVVTDWDITKASAEGVCDATVNQIMTKEVIFAAPSLTILDIVREFEQYQISAMPIVLEGKVLGKISSDLIAQRYILNFLQD
jgi:CBS domain-containing protein